MATPELSIDTVIGSDGWFSGITSSYVNRWLRDNAKASEILVRLNTPGGDVFEGMAIYTALKRSNMRIVMEVEGLAASAGSLILMAGDVRRVHQGAFVMVHEGWALTMGPREDHQKTADLLAKINGEMAQLYAERTGITVEKASELMAANDTWLTASEALDLGFVDAVIPAKGKAPKKSRASAQMLSRFKNAPQSVLRMFEERQANDGGDRSDAHTEPASTPASSAPRIAALRKTNSFPAAKLPPL